MRLSFPRASATLLSLVVFSLPLIGCDGGSGDIEKVPPAAQNTPPDMSKMPGYNEMQAQLKTKGVKNAAPVEKAAPKTDEKAAAKPEEKPATPAK